MRQQLITIPLLNVLVQWIKDRLDEKSNTNHTHGSVTTTQDGFMTSADKTKLNGIAANANKTTIVDTLTSTSTTSALSANQGRLLNSSLSGKANAVHEHAKYLSELPLPLTKIGETDGQMTYDGQVVAGGGGGEPAWGEYGQFKKVIVDAGISTRVPAFYDFVRDHYAYQPGMYVFLTKPTPTANMVYSEDGVMVTKMYDEGIWLDLGGEGLPPPFAITDIPNIYGEMLEESSLLVYDNLELEGEPIASFGRTDLPAFKRQRELAYATIYNRFNDYQGHLHDTSVELHLHDRTHSHSLEIDGRWRTLPASGGSEYLYDGNPYPEP